MSYIGNTNTTQAFTPAVDYFSGNASTTAFTLSRPVASVAQVQAVVNNVAQNPSDAFTVSGSTITFTSAPSTGTNNIYVYYTSPITQVIAPGQGTVTTTSLTDASVTTAKLASTTGTGSVALASLPTFTTTIGVGGATASASGSGISFPATQSASSDANTLDDYEEGAWTPTLGGTSTYSIQEGKYTKIGNFVYVVGILVVASLGTGSTTTVTGLPFTSATQAERYGGSIAYWGSIAVSALNLLVFINNNSTTVQFTTITTAGTNVGTDTAAVWGGSAHIQFSLCYRV